MPTSVLGPLVLALVLATGQATSHVPSIDGDAVATALAVRLGDAAQRWTIEIRPGARASDVVARLRRDDGRELRRTVTLAGQTDDARARELAAALSLAIEQDEEGSAATLKRSTRAATSGASTDAPRTGWIAAGAHVGAGRPFDATGGVSLRGGVWWGRRLLQPLVAVASEHARPGAVRLDGVRVGAGLAIGAPIGAWWLGGSALPSYAWTRAVRRRDDRASSFVTELAALAQLRHRNLLLGLRAGLDVRAPSLRLVGGDDEHRLGNLRFVTGFELGLTLPLRAR
jgi:hypothetical protein